jgi:protein-disulfide isomerase
VRRSHGVDRPPTRREILQLLALSGVGAGAGAFLRSRAPIGRDMSRNAIAQRILSDRTSPQFGPSGANLAVAVFSDYQCPACRFAEPSLLRAVAADGRVRIIYRDWPVFGARSEHAARVALAANFQGRYQALHHLLMIEPGELDEAVVRDLAVRAGAHRARLEHDLSVHGATISAALGRTGWDAFSLGLPGTPGYLIGPLLVVGAQTFSGFQGAFEKARELMGSQNG